MRNIFNKKIISVVLTTLLVLTVIITLVSCVNTGDKTHIVDNNGNELTGNKVHELPSGMTFVSDSAGFKSKSIKLTATVKPEGATNKNLNWTVMWVNASSAWANGKSINDYLTLGITDNIATLTCHVPFGERAKLEVSSVSNPEVRAQCILDFERQLIGLEVDVFETKNNTETKAGILTERTIDTDMSGIEIVPHKPQVKISDINKFEVTQYRFVPRAVYSVGTVSNELILSENPPYLTLSSSFFSAYTNKGGELDAMLQEIDMQGSWENGYTINISDILMLFINAGITTNEDFARVTSILETGNCIFSIGFGAIQCGNSNLTFSQNQYCFGAKSDAIAVVSVTEIILDNSAVIF